jgi:hypothetical protein
MIDETRNRNCCKSIMSGSTGSPRTGQQAHHERDDRLTTNLKRLITPIKIPFTLSLSKGLVRVL